MHCLVWKKKKMCSRINALKSLWFLDTKNIPIKDSISSFSKFLFPLCLHIGRLFDLKNNEINKVAEMSVIKTNA